MRISVYFFKYKNKIKIPETSSSYITATKSQGELIQCIKIKYTQNSTQQDKRKLHVYINTNRPLNLGLLLIGKLPIYCHFRCPLHLSRDGEQ